jgi:hypothetical protein
MKKEKDSKQPCKWTGILRKNIFWFFLPFIVFCLISAYLLISNNYEKGELAGKYIIIYSFFD